MGFLQKQIKQEKIGKVAEEDDEINSIFGEIQRTEKVKIKDAMKVGDFVQYEADESEYTIPAEIAGAEQTIRTDNTVKWRVWKIDEENVIIIPAQSVNPIKLYGVAGYQNGPEAINYACKELYKNTSLVINSSKATLVSLVQSNLLKSPVGNFLHFKAITLTPVSVSN